MNITDNASQTTTVANGHRLVFLSSGHSMNLDAYLKRGRHIGSLFQKRGVIVRNMEKPEKCRVSDFSFTMEQLGDTLPMDLNTELCKAGVAATIVSREGDVAIVNIRSLHNGTR